MREERKRHRKKVLEEFSGLKLSKFGEKHKFTDPRNSTNPKQGKCRENQTRVHESLTSVTLMTMTILKLGQKK